MPSYFNGSPIEAISVGGAEIEERHPMRTADWDGTAGSSAYRWG